MTETIVLSGGRRATFEVIGDGEPLIWFEGGPGFSAILGRGDCAVIADRFRCYLVDQPGTGGTTPPGDERQYGLRGTAAFFEEVREALGLGAVTVLGHSWGGAVCLAYAALHPHGARRCIALDAWAASRSVDEGKAAEAEMAAGLVRHEAEPWNAAACAAFHAGMSPDLLDRDHPEGVWNPAWPLYFAHPERPLAQAHIARLCRDLRFYRGPWLHGERAAYEDDLSALLPGITVPTLVVVGELDFVCGPSQAQSIAAQVPGSELVVIPGCGHIPPYEEPEEFRRIVYRWCDAH